METLTKTSFFCELTKSNSTLTTEELSSFYKEFIHNLIKTCINPTTGIPAFFILNYTRIELMGMQEKYKLNGTGKKCRNGTISVESNISIG